jgi:hypothetical protein
MKQLKKCQQCHNWFERLRGLFCLNCKRWRQHGRKALWVGWPR